MTSSLGDQSLDKAPPKRIKTVIFQYEDGTVSYLQGKEAVIWLVSQDGAALLSSVHGRPEPEFNWKDITPEEAAKLLTP